ncbi:hypothetical protein U879_14810 [Defluviimonas sp. 20V17]|uniref:DUF5337 domain-containing protein n=1 Tax=Allgaiera indica TaxID=765699 RepID=A0AAN4URK5_9RHOB|nr:DUF5337 family protein [Allgaiera indica]KDB02946.1 hypothetical protein U879_14810 [Defluviimonas sp. 20V17]GHE01430.1 hypothetical protein GCM10008024_16870 [Allgaiera indica]SDW86632.1 hypothetical protein SAMN05444006_107150 [Allgaiera indica]
MNRPDDTEERAQAAQMRLAALVIAIAMVVWLGGQWLGGWLGLDPRLAFLMDFAALAAFVFAFVVVWRVWRRRQDNKE